MNTIKRARIAYDGKALQDGSMDIRDLAPALLAFSELTENIYRVLGGERKIKLLLNENSIQRGSFDITMLLDISILEQAKLFMKQAEDTGLKDLMDILGFATGVTGVSAVSIFSLIKLIGKKKVKNIEELKNGKVRLNLQGDSSLLIGKNLFHVFMDYNCRLSVEKVLSPLVNSEGIDTFETRNPENQNNKTPIEKVSKQDVELFNAPPQQQAEYEDELVSSEQEMLVRLELISFVDGKWKVTDGTNHFWITIQDEMFNRQLEQREIFFGKGDTLKIRVYIKQSLKNGNLTSEHIVTKVLEHRIKPTQIKLDFEQ